MELKPKDIAAIAAQVSLIIKEDIQNLKSDIKLEIVKVEINLRSSFDERLQVLESNLNSSIRDLRRRVGDIESDQRTTQAIGRAVLDSGISFKDTRIPYPLQGNAAIEDIKDYY